MNYKKIIKIDKNLLKNLKEEAIKIKKEIDNLWNKCENEKLDCDEVAYLVEEKEKELTDKFILFNISKMFDKEINRKEKELYDVSKIVVSRNFDKIMREFDKEILTMIKGNFYKEDYIEKEISMLYLFQGFRLEKEEESLEDYKFYFMEDFLREDN